MSKALSSIKDKAVKLDTIKRRLKSGSKGLGYWGARDAARRIGLQVEGVK